MKHLYLILVILGLVWGKSDLPPAIPVKAVNSNCKVPPWLVHLPPGMEPDYKDCVNDTFKPSKNRVNYFLKKKFHKDAQFVDLKVADEFFTRVYRVRYKIKKEFGALLCNDRMNYCVKDEPIGKIKKGKVQ